MGSGSPRSGWLHPEAEISLDVPLPPAEVEIRLRASIAPPARRWPWMVFRTLPPFEGLPDEAGFVVERLTLYPDPWRTRAQLRWQPAPSGTTVRAQVSLRPLAGILTRIWYLTAAAAAVAAVLGAVFGPLRGAFSAALVAVCAAYALVPRWDFRTEVNKTRSLLVRILR